MNTLMLVVLAVVLLCYCGGKYCPKVLSSNKEVVLGVLVGMVLCSFAGLRVEGLIQARKEDGGLVEITSVHDNEQCCALKNEMTLQGVPEMWDSVIRPVDCPLDIKCGKGQ